MPHATTKSLYEKVLLLPFLRIKRNIFAASWDKRHYQARHRQAVPMQRFGTLLGTPGPRCLRPGADGADTKDQMLNVTVVRRWSR